MISSLSMKLGSMISSVLKTLESPGATPQPPELYDLVQLCPVAILKTLQTRIDEVNYSSPCQLPWYAFHCFECPVQDVVRMSSPHNKPQLFRFGLDTCERDASGKEEQSEQTPDAHIAPTNALELGHTAQASELWRYRPRMTIPLIVAASTYSKNIELYPR